MADANTADVTRIEVRTPEGKYPIHIGHGLRGRIAEFVGGRRVVIITNATLAPLYGEAMREALGGCALVVMPDGERYKTLDTVSRFYVQLVQAGLDRSGVIVALGGGVVGDSAGFAAATYLRGVRLIQVPTSLLAMVDSSVGGKVGVDLPEGKNLVGAFKQPEAVLIDPDVLATLPAQEWRCGMAEVLKHGLLADNGLLDPSLHTPDRAAELVRRAVQVKVNVVERDPFEAGERAHLNLGHTFAHAIEQVSGYAWPHGEAVGVGLLAAARLSNRLGLCGDELPALVEDILTETGLPTRIGPLSPEALWSAMHTDKKWLAGRSRFVLLLGLQQPSVIEGVEKADVLAVLEGLT
jgi:3-dehydroquinate synthase